MQLISMAVSIGTIWGKVWPILVAILFFGFLILSHELGHFSMARLFRVRVNEFSLGMGPRLLKFKRKGGETLYSLKAIPFGGSVLMEGEDEASEDARAFGNQKAWKRFCILIAGAMVNLICGVIIMGVIIGMLPYVGTPEVESFVEASTSCDFGLEVGDEIIKVDGHRVFSYLDVSYLLSRVEGKTDIVVKRDGKRVKLEDVEFPQREVEGKLNTLRDFSLVYYSRDPADEGRSGRTTIAMRVKETFGESVTYVRMVWLSLLDMVTGKYSLRDISGPIGVVNILSEGAQQVQEGAASEDEDAARDALLMLLNLFALISINIGVMNLLPLPALDGGRLFFCLIEMIFRKPVPKKFEAYVHAAGFVLLMIFMVIIAFSDIWSLIKG